MGKSGVLQEMGRLFRHRRKLKGPFPGSNESSDSVFASPTESISSLVGITRLRQPYPDSLRDLPPNSRQGPRYSYSPRRSFSPPTNSPFQGSPLTLSILQ